MDSSTPFGTDVYDLHRMNKYALLWMFYIPGIFSCFLVKMIRCCGTIDIPLTLRYNGSTKVKED